VETGRFHKGSVGVKFATTSLQTGASAGFGSFSPGDWAQGHRYHGIHIILNRKMLGIPLARVRDTFRHALTPR
jgi:hypothetical protein